VLKTLVIAKREQIVKNDEICRFIGNKVLKWEKISGFYHLAIWATLFGTTIHNL
jgi:hypothetical protein